MASEHPGLPPDPEAFSERQPPERQPSERRLPERQPSERRLPERRPPAPRALAAWIVILLAVAGIIGTNLIGQWQLEREADDTAELIMLRLQAKLLLGLAQIPNAASQIAPEVVKLGEEAKTERIARAVVALSVALPGATSQERKQALELLQRFQDAPGGDEAILDEAVVVAVREPGRLDEAGQQRLRDDLGWFAELLLTHHLDRSDPGRRQILSEARTAAVLFVGAVAAGGMGVVAGLVLLSMAWVQYSKQRLRLRLCPPTAYGAIYLQAFAVYLAGMLLLVLLPSHLELAGLDLLGLALVSMTGVLWPVLRGAEVGQVLRDLGLTRGEGFFREAACGLVGHIAMLPVIGVGFGLTVVLAVVKQHLDAASPDQVSQPVFHPVVPLLADGGTAIRLLVLLLAAVFAPFFEEIIFRGALFAHLRRRLAPLSAALLMSLLFAVIHPQGWVTVPAITSLAFAFALLREWRGSLIAPMVGHGVHNGALVALMWAAFG